ncbi:unnamed protein product [Brassica rapa]|nr:unnamed protein product [Brassica napus]CAG7895070.1 unnamed protein product [Brassica rapa]
MAFSTFLMEIQEPYLLPGAINNLVGKTFLFKISIERKNYLYKHETYKVLKIITNTEMISEFEVTNSPTGSENIAAIDNSIVSYAPEGSMMLRGCPSGGFKHVKTIDGFSKILFEPDDVPEIQSFRMR